MNHFLNARAALVSDAIDGEILASGGRLTRLGGDPEIRVVVRAGWDKSKVALISGGGAGHEPAHVGFVGEGMLTAAVCGDVFASPSTDAVLAAILAVTGPAGALLIVKNYTGDRLNFGLAAERARAMGRAVEMVVVGDDVALPDIAQPRGIAGTLFVHKIAGDAAERGLDLASVTAAASAASRATRSVGMALTTCTIPGREAEARIAEGEAELGLGIHGEPGAERIRVVAAERMVETLLAKLVPHALGPEVRLALLINNLGGLPPIELAVVTKAVLASPLGRQVDLVFGPAPLMTSLDMKGFSVSILPLDDARRAALLAPVGLHTWPPGVRPGPSTPLPMPEDVAARSQTRPGVGTQETADTRAWIDVALAALIGIEDELNRLDAKVGDGDTGTTVATAARAIGADLDGIVSADWGDTLTAMALRTGKVMGGSSGVLISIMLSASGAALSRGATWQEALATGLERVTFYGGATEGDRTMLDALAPAVAALAQGGGLPAMAAAAQAGADRTAMVASTRAGRSSYLRADDLLGTKDPGAVAVATLIGALALHAGRPTDAAGAQG